MSDYERMWKYVESLDAEETLQKLNETKNGRGRVVVLPDGTRVLDHDLHEALAEWWRGH